MDKAFILDFLTKNKTALKESYGVQKIGLFGSYARGDFTDESDIDIAVEIESSKKTLNTFFELKREMERAFGKRVDLGIESTLKPIAKEMIDREIIYA